MRIRFASCPGVVDESLTWKKIEFAQLKSQIEILSTFLPDCLLNDDNIESKENVQFVGVILDIQIMGMHRLVEKYNKVSDGGVYKLTCILNAYLSLIIETVHYWGGDVIKILGNRCVNLWRVSADESLCEILHNVVICACIIMDELEDFDTSLTQRLTMKMGIASGNLTAHIYGVDTKILIFRGEAMEEINRLSYKLKSGDIFISSRAWAHMVQERYNVVTVDATTIQLVNGVIAYRASERHLHAFFQEKGLEARLLVTMHIQFMKNQLNYTRIDTKEVMSKLKNDFLQKLPIRSAVKYSPMHCDMMAIRSFVCQKLQHQIDEHQPVEYLTEMTTLTSQIISLKPRSLECLTDAFIRHIHTEIMKHMTDNAFIYIFEVTDVIKIVIISGLDGARHQLENQLALRSGYRMSQTFQNIPDVECVSIGLFHGFLCCGVIGHPFRRAFTVLGTVLSKAFRLTDYHKGKVICDLKTFKFSRLPSFYFQCIGLKRCTMTTVRNQLLVYDENVDLQNIDERGSIFPRKQIFGRTKELKYINRLIEDKSKIGCALIFSGVAKLGKQLLVTFALERITNSNDFMVSSIELEDFTTTPFFVINKLYRQLYDNNSMIQDNRSVLKLPADLIDLHGSYPIEDQDIGMIKYRILNTFREMVLFGNKKTTFLVISNFQYVDAQSWEILEIVLGTSNIRILGSGTFDVDMAKKIKKCAHVTFFEMAPLSNYWMHTLACYWLGVGALSLKLSTLLINTCQGRPGYMQSCISYFINSENLDLIIMLKENLTSDYVPIHYEIWEQLPQKITVMVTINRAMTDNNKNLEVTIASITKEFYHTLSRFEKAIVNTSSVLGKLFTRNLLIVALNYPAKLALQEGIKTMFQKGILECGSKFVNGTPITANKYCCRCYMTQEEMFGIEDEKYPHCKVFHFRNEALRDIVYTLIPVNHRKDLHLMSADVLESSIHACPSCLRDPINQFIVRSKYKEVVENIDNNTFTITQCPVENTEHLKECIRRTIRDKTDWNITDPSSPSQSFRPIFDPTKCYCFDTMLFIYRQLIYHSKGARHLCKLIFFATAYGRVLILANDVTNAITVLREARELSLNNIHTPQAQISESFRKYFVGRISMGIAYAFLALRQLNQAKNYMALALRQYNIPSLVFNYVHLQTLLAKPFLIHADRLHPVALKPTWKNWEMAMCLITCARLYALEGNLKYAKYCSSYSIWILKQINDRMPMLFDTYCDVIDLYRYGLDTQICEKLQKYVSKEVLLNYCNNKGFYAKHIMHLLMVKFELKIIGGKLRQAINLCYRIIDYTLKTYLYINQFEIIAWLSILFGYTMRFKDFVDLMNLIKKNVLNDSTIWYYSNALGISLMTGYSYLPMESLFKDIINYFNYNPQERLNWDKNHLLSQVYLHLLKSDMFHMADQYMPICPFTATTLKRPIVLRILLNMIEAGMTEIYYIMKKQGRFSRLKATLERQFALATEHSKCMQLFQPRLYCLRAWYFKLFGEAKKANKTLRKAEKISLKQGDLYHACLVRQLRSHWSGFPAVMSYLSTLEFDLIGDPLYFNEDQWAQVLQPYRVFQ